MCPPLITHTHTCSESWQKMTDTVVAEGQVKFRDGKKVIFNRFSSFHGLKHVFNVSRLIRGKVWFVVERFSTVEDPLGGSSEAFSRCRYVPTVSTFTTISKGLDGAVKCSDCWDEADPKCWSWLRATVQQLHSSARAIDLDGLEMDRDQF